MIRTVCSERENQVCTLGKQTTGKYWIHCSRSCMILPHMHNSDLRIEQMKVACYAFEDSGHGQSRTVVKHLKHAR